MKKNYLFLLIPLCSNQGREHNIFLSIFKSGDLFTRRTQRANKLNLKFKYFDFLFLRNFKNTACHIDFFYAFTNLYLNIFGHRYKRNNIFFAN